MRASDVARARQINSVRSSVSPVVSPGGEFEGESAESKANLRNFLLSGMRPASRAHHVLNYVLSCVLANSKVSLLRLRQTCEKCSLTCLLVSFYVCVGLYLFVFVVV